MAAGIRDRDEDMMRYVKSVNFGHPRSDSM